MKICLINNLYEPYARGGAENIIKILAMNLIERNHEVIIITTKPYESFKSLKPSVKKQGNLKIYRFYPLNIFSYFFISKWPWFVRIFFHLIDLINFHSFFVIYRIIKEEKPNIVHMHNLKGLSYWIPIICSKLKTPSIFTPHDVQLVEPSGLVYVKRNGQLKKPLLLHGCYMLINRWFIKPIDLVIAPSQFIVNFYKNFGFFQKSTVVVLPNPIKSNHPLKKNYQGILKIFHLIYIGQLEKHKGIIVLLNLVKKYFNHSIYLHIFGRGRLKDVVERASKENKNIIYHGYIKYENLYKAFEIADMIIVPSLCCENSPGVIYESLSFGVPVLATRVGGIPELVNDNFNGFTFLPSKMNRINNIINQLRKNPKLLLRLRHNAYSSVVGYSIRNYIDQLLNYYYTLLRDYNK